MKLKVVLFFLMGSIAVFGAFRFSRGDTLPALLVSAEVEKMAGAKETIGGPFPGLLVVPQNASEETDEKNHQPYHAVCAVYAAESAGGAVVRYTLRFLVHAPDADSLPLARRAAKLLLLLHGENRERLGYEHPKSTPRLDVWLSRQAGAGLDADIGGEQFGSQIYIYSIFTERSPTEWVREIAHEYGHCALPGVTGFTEPEAWANGVLGERLFLKWLGQDAALKRLQSADIPFITQAQLSAYQEKQITPLIISAAQNGPDAKRLARKDAAGMDAFIGLVLACDSLYGSRQLKDIFACMASSHGDDFLYAPDFARAIAVSLLEAAQWTITPPLPETAKPQTFFAFLPKGDWTVSADNAAVWRLAGLTKSATFTKTRLMVRVSGWHKMTVIGTNGKSPALTFRKRGG